MGRGVLMYLWATVARVAGEVSRRLSGSVNVLSQRTVEQTVLETMQKLGSVTHAPAQLLGVSEPG